jgi:hypothetical protein
VFPDGLNDRGYHLNPMVWETSVEHRSSLPEEIPAEWTEARWWVFPPRV